MAFSLSIKHYKSSAVAEMGDRGHNSVSHLTHQNYPFATSNFFTARTI